MLRRTLLYLSSQPAVFRFVRNNRMAKGFASRFVAGETVEAALDAAARLNAQGITATLDLLGESVSNDAEARAAAREYVRMLDRIAERRIDSNVSLKLTQMGLDISEDLCVANVQEILERARAHGNFVRIDMESSAYTDRTLRLFYDRFYPNYASHVGIVLQSALRRTYGDAGNACAARARVRLCKGAYREPDAVAYQEKKDVDESFVRALHLLVEQGNYPGLATHDERMIEEARRFTREKGIAADRYEFQMLYGVRRDLQERLVRDGYRMRVYIPFGTQWYPYLMRRLAERPANVAFIAGSVMKEMASGKR